MKINKRVLVSLLLAIAMLVVFTACGQQSATENKAEKKASEPEKEEMITLRLAHHLTEDYGVSLYAAEFAKKVNEKTNGKVTIELYANSQLGGQKELLEALRIGTVDMSISDTGLLANYEQSIGILDMPYIFNDIEHTITVLSSNVGEELKDKVMKASGIRPLTFQGVAFRNTLLSKKEIKSLDDFKGIKVRTPNNPTIISTMETLGANPTAIPSGEAYTAIQTGVVDGMEGNPEFLSSIKIYEVAKKWYETKHNMTCTSLNISQQVFEGFSPEIQQIFIDSANEALDFFYEHSKNVDTEKREFLKNQGVVFSDLDREPLRQKVEPMVSEFVQANGIESIYEDIQKLGE